MCYDELTLLTYVDEEMSETEHRAIAGHVRQCARCRALVAALENESRALFSVLREPAGWSEAGSVPSVAVPVAHPSRAAVAAVLGATVTSVAAVRFFVESTDMVAVPFALAWLNPFGAEGRMNLFFNAVAYAVEHADEVPASAVTLASQAAVLTLLWSALCALVRRPAWRVGVVASLVVSVVLTAVPSEAVEVRRGGSDAARSVGSVTVPAAETVDDTLVALGETVVVDGTVTGDLFAGARRVRVRGTVKGNVFASAQSLDVEGVVEGGVFMFGQALTASGHTQGSLYFFGQSAVVSDSGRIDGDMTTFSQSATIDGHVGRDVTAFGQRLDVKGTVARRVTTHGDRVTLLAPARVGGALTAYVPNRDAVRVEPGATVVGTPDIRVSAPAPSRYRTASFYVRQAGWVLAAVLSGWLLLWLVPAAGAITLDSGPKLWRALGAGALCAVATPILAVLVGFTLVGLPVAIAGLFSWVAGLYLAKIALALVVGRSLVGQRPRGGDRLALAAGVVALAVVVSLPYVGTLTNLLLTVTGLGLIVLEAAHWFRGSHGGARVPA